MASKSLSSGSLILLSTCSTIPQMFFIASFISFAKFFSSRVSVRLFYMISVSLRGGKKSCDHVGFSFFQISLNCLNLLAAC